MKKRQHISNHERLTWIQSKLSDFSIYLISLLSFLRIVKIRLEKFQRDFLWKDGIMRVKSSKDRWHNEEPLFVSSTPYIP